MTPSDATAGDLAWRSSLMLVAGIAGAAGVMLAALAAHVRPSALMQTSANILLVHTVAVVALAALAGQTSRPSAWLGVATAMLAGAVLFSADIALYATKRVHIFPLAAPTGGTMLILSWLAISLIAAVELAFPRHSRDLPEAGPRPAE